MSLLVVILINVLANAGCKSEDHHHYAIKTKLPYEEILELIEFEDGTLLKEVKHLQFFHARFDQPVGSKQIQTWNIWPFSWLFDRNGRRRIHEHPEVELHYQHPRHISKRDGDPYKNEPTFDKIAANQYPHPHMENDMEHENDKTYIPAYRALVGDLKELFPVNDPGADYAWQYLNDGLKGSPLTGFDLNIRPAYLLGQAGRGIKSVVLDDALDTKHADLVGNYDASISGNVVEHNISDDPRGPNEIIIDDDQHGTQCAGLIAASVNNNVCSHGVAFHSSIGAVRLLSGVVTDITEAESLSHHYHDVDIYCASWGPTDDGMTLDIPRKFSEEAFEHGAVYGRRGLGSINVFASGNGGFFGDNCGADGFASSPYVIAVAALDNSGQKTIYSESCAATRFAVPIGTPEIKGIIKGDLLPSTLGNNRCKLSFVGTSAAAPLGAGCIALALGARPSLSTHDLEWLFPFAARVPYPNDKGWQVNGAGVLFNSHAGFGLLDCTQLVQMAMMWNPVGPLCITGAVWGEPQPETWEDNQDSNPSRPFFRLINNQDEAMIFVGEIKSYYNTPQDSVYILTNQSALVTFNIPAASPGYLPVHTVSQCQVEVVEKIVVKYEWVHICRGSMQVWLRSPSGMKIVLLDNRSNDSFAGTGRMMAASVAHWGERIEGEWQLEILSGAKCNNPVINAMNETIRGLLKYVKIEFWGTTQAESGFERNGALINTHMVGLSRNARQDRKAHLLTKEETHKIYDEQRWMALNNSRSIVDSVKRSTTTKPTVITTTRLS